MRDATALIVASANEAVGDRLAAPSARPRISQEAGAVALPTPRGGCQPRQLPNPLALVPPSARLGATRILARVLM